MKGTSSNSFLLPTAKWQGGTMRRVALTLLLSLLTMVTAWAQESPVVGCIEVCQRVSVDSVYVKGWAYFPENPEDSVDVLVCGYEGPECTIYDEYTEAAFWANLPRPDVNEQQGITGNHGFEGTIEYRSDCYVKFIAIDSNINLYPFGDVVYLRDYGLVVGGVGVTTENMGNILDELDADGHPTASFDEATRTLTLNESAKLSSYDGCLITSAEDLTIKGRFHMSANNFSTSCAIEVYYPYSLTLDGDFLFFSKKTGIDAQNEITLSSGRLAIGCEEGFAINNPKEIIIKDTFEKLELKSMRRVLASETLTLPDNLSIITPAGGSFSEDRGSFVEADGTTYSTYVIIATQAAAAEPNTPLPDYFPLWVGDTRVSTVNMADILGDGGKAQFNPSTGTLTLNNPTITGSYHYSKIYVGAGLNITVEGKCNINEADAWFGIGLDDDAHYSINGEYQDVNPSLTLSGDFTFRGSTRGISGERNDVTVRSGTLTAIGVSAGIRCENLTVLDGASYVELEATRYKSLYCSSLTLGESLGVIFPTDYHFNEGIYNAYALIQDKNMTAPGAIDVHWDDHAGTATFTWTPPTTTYPIQGYAYCYKRSNDADWSDEVTVNTTSVTVPELSFYTGFTFKVRAVYSKPGHAYKSFSHRGPVSLPYEDGFEHGTGEWTIVGSSDSGLTNTYQHNGDMSCVLQHPYNSTTMNSENPIYLISPLFSDETFIKMSGFTSGKGTFYVGFSSTTMDPDAFDWGQSLQLQTTKWNSFSLYCPAHTRYVAIKGLEGSYLVFDDFTFEEFTPPAAPSALAAADVTATSALITWTGETPMYYVRYKTAAKFAEDNANGCGGYNWAVEETEENHLKVTGLQPLTEYVLQVMAYQSCYYSDWSAPFTFTLYNYTILANDDDNLATITACDSEMHDVLLQDRTIYCNGAWNTLCLPFDVTDGDANDGISFSGTPLAGTTVMTLGSSDFTDGTLTLNFTEATSIEAGRPYIVRWPDGVSLTIRSDADWQIFAQRVEEGETFAGKNVLLCADINVSTMVGTADHPFCGTFDGNGHTLHLSISQADADYAAPFRYISNATICNVKVTGSVNGRQYSAGLVGASMGGTNSIRDCWMSADVTGQGCIGGVLGHGTTSATTISNCFMNGTLSGNGIGVFCGWGSSGGTHTVENCWCMGQYNNVAFGSGSDLVRTDGGTISITNCRQNVAETAQGSYYELMIVVGGSADPQYADFLGSQWTVDESDYLKLNPSTATFATNIVNPVVTGVTISNAAVPAETDYVNFIGCTSPVDFAANDRTRLFLGAQNTLYFPNAAMAVGSCRAHFQLKNGITAGDPNDPQTPVRAFCLNFGGSSVETGITATRHMNVTNPNGAWHTLDGRRLSGKPTQRGIYINDGRKTVIE